MATVNIFVSFEYDKDKDLRNNFYQQAKTLSPHRIGDSSLRKTYPNNDWKDKARNAIRQCDVVIILIGEATHNAPGVKIEVDIARNLGKPVIQIRPRRRSQTGVPNVKKPIPWKWKRINERLAALQASRAARARRNK